MLLLLWSGDVEIRLLFGWNLLLLLLCNLLLWLGDLEIRVWFVLLLLAV